MDRARGRWTPGENLPRIRSCHPGPDLAKVAHSRWRVCSCLRPVHSCERDGRLPLPPGTSDEEGADGPSSMRWSTIFGSGPGTANGDIRGLLNAGHRRGASAGRCVIRRQTVETEELPAYCAVALAGCMIYPTRSTKHRRTDATGHDETVDAFRHRVARPQAEPIRHQSAAWMEGQASAHSGTPPRSARNSPRPQRRRIPGRWSRSLKRCQGEARPNRARCCGCCACCGCSG